MLSALLLAVTIVAHEPGYSMTLANHIQRWLRGHEIAARVVTPREMSAALAHERLSFLVGFAEPTASELQVLKNYRARGGKLVVFHSASPALGALMGVRPLGYQAAPVPGRWSRMDFVGKPFPGCPGSILQTSSVLMRIAPVKGRGVTIATWSDRAGRPTGDAAWVKTDAGWWMSHVLLADGDEALKAQFLAGLCGSVDPKLWNASRALTKANVKSAALSDYAQRQWLRPGEIHAVWDHSGCGLYPGNWPKTIRLLKDSHVTDLFVNLAGQGFAHYPSKVLPVSKAARTDGDQLAACLAAAKGSGIRVHAWVLCFSAARAAPDVLEAYRTRGWRLKATNGRLTDYLDPANASVRARMLSAIDEMQARAPTLAGIHLDFVRWGESVAKPKNAAAVITQFVSDARRHVRRPRWLTAAVYGGYPRCVSTVGQDWSTWLDLNFVDYIVPMDYTESPAKYLELLASQATTRNRARRTIIGIGVTANESRLDAHQVIDQIKISRKFGFAGQSLFDLDTTLEKQILPYLRLAIW